VDVPLYGLDIETDTEAGGLDPSRAAILAVAVSTTIGDVVFQGDESSILTRVDAYLAGLAPGVIVTWNGATFDLPFIARRAERGGLELGLRLRLDERMAVRDPLPWLEGAYRATWHDHGHLDGYRLYRGDVGRTLPVSCSLKSISRMVGLSPVEVDVVNLHALHRTDVATYVASDARMARLLVDRRAPAALAAVD
jgi:uncharacterized protein YprB with RNaseH-like and TPR domain